MHLTSSPIDWYAARAGGIAAYLLITLGVLLGLTMSSRRRSERWPRMAVEDVHRFVGLLTGAFLVIHVLTVAIDSYLPFSLGSIVVPFISKYRPAWVGLGIVAAELLLALAVTNRLRERSISYRMWRRAHYLNFVVWTAATVHGLGSGTDRSTTWMLAIYAASISSVLAFTTFRVLRRSTVPRLVLVTAPAGAATFAVVGALALSLGPLHFRPKPWNAARFSEELDGRVQRQLGATRGIVSLAGQGVGDQRVLVRADLLIAPNRLLDTIFQMEYLPSGTRCRGNVTNVDSDGLGFEARCRLPDGRLRRVTARWLGSDGSTLSGGTITSAA